MRRWRVWKAAAPTIVTGTVLCFMLAACAGKGDRRPDGGAEPVDGPSNIGLSAADVVDAVPRQEPRARYGNHSPYEVFGRKYYVMPTADGYVERGIASWYGTKFHGRRTSSGEPYDMHLATAAHKTLPLPTYAEVTNLENGRRVVVKINDRGPFKDDRIIDLSYGAALRLGMTGKGTARVEVRAIDTAGLQLADSRDPAGTYLQAGAFGQRAGAEALVGRLKRASLQPVTIDDGGNLFRVWLGPFDSTVEIERVIQRAIELGFERPHRVTR
ncbi:septal ring lytic transglycosylase RlpA family protein [Elongatibacter sediminis]|uniref:Endolytic peptidoglycan transglycosylase RlpA n=1 Tax=Elongatibacter sediminis TaxID=3119006 RepID=A0AAW9RDN4_9GAMM